MKTIPEMQAEVEEVNTEKGWYDSPVEFPTAMALMHSEISEAFEAWREWGLHDVTAVTFDAEAGSSLAGKPEGVGSEFADILIRLLDYASRFDIDLEAEYERKLAYNKTRPYRHGGKAA